MRWLAPFWHCIKYTISDLYIEFSNFLVNGKNLELSVMKDDSLSFLRTTQPGRRRRVPLKRIRSKFSHAFDIYFFHLILLWTRHESLIVIKVYYLDRHS